MIFNWLVTIFAGIFSFSLAFAKSPQEDRSPKVLRTAGTYLVSQVEKLRNGEFLIEFRSENITGRFDILKLSSDHVHVAVKVGEKIRLSAEVSAERGAMAEISQVVVFLPNPMGAVPIWLLSNKTPPKDLRAVNYLKMHVPQTDYMVL